MQSVTKDSNVLDDKQQSVVTKPFSEKKSLATEKVTTGDDEVQKRIEKVTTSEEVVRGFDEVHKRTANITTNQDVDKGTEKQEYTKEAVVTIRRKD